MAEAGNFSAVQIGLAGIMVKENSHFVYLGD